jgi:hypothetical protein
VSDADLKHDVLTTASDAALMYEGECLFAGQHDDFGYVLSIVVGGGVGRNDSVVTLAKVWGDADHGERARRVQIIDIPLCVPDANSHELTGVIHEYLTRYPNVSVVLNDNGMGNALGQHLKAQGIYYKPVNWGGSCFSNENRNTYFNKRSQANVCLSRSIVQGRFKITTSKYQDQIKKQVMQRLFSFDVNARFKMASKDDMQNRGIRSPHIADTFAFLFLESVSYIGSQPNKVVV